MRKNVDWDIATDTGFMRPDSQVPRSMVLAVLMDIRKELQLVREELQQARREVKEEALQPVPAPKIRILPPEKIEPRVTKPRVTKARVTKRRKAGA